MARTQQYRAVGRESRQVENGRFDADRTLAAIEDAGDRMVGTEFIAHMLGGGRADMAEFIGRRRGDTTRAPLEGAQQRLRHRMRRTTDADRILAAGDGVGNMGGPLQDQAQGTGPERGDQLARLVRYGRSPVSKISLGRDMHDHRMIGRPALGGIDARHGVDRGWIDTRIEAGIAA